MIETQEQPRERAILIGLSCPMMDDFDNSDEDTMAELGQLLKTAGGETVLETIQNRRTPDPHTFIGEGKAQEIKELIQAHEVDLVVFDNEISPSQTKALEGIFDCRVIDRSALILDIFADRAKTREGKLQVELAQYQYLLPRLSGMWGHLVRQTASGGKSPIGTRGPGETQLETDRRHIRRKIQKLEQELETVRKVRATQRGLRQKNNIPLVCLVGYTNAGKSTMLNAITGAAVQTGDRLFDTLDPTTRVLERKDNSKMLISDTVGFIRKLPHHLIEAFQSTLEELTYANVLVHVIDAANPLWREQAAVVDDLIRRLGAHETPQVVVLNKVDLLQEDQLPRVEGAIYSSAGRGIGVENILSAIEEKLSEGMTRMALLIPYDEAGLIDALFQGARVFGTEYLPEGIRAEVSCDRKMLSRVGKYAVGGEASGAV